MQELDDISLLREFTERNAEQAFAALVERHINKVYSVALRHTRNPNSAEEITHVVFVILAQKAKQLRKGVILEGWLYETARLTALTCIRGEIRRARREQEAYMQTVSNENESEAWAQIAPNLDAALAGLNATDRTAVVLRFFYGKSMSEIGATLGGTEESARKRVSRAIEKLRGYFSKRGITSTAATMTAALSVNAVQAAPAALIKTTTALALANGATASTSTSTLTKGVLKIMAWSKTKTSVIAAIAMLLAVGSPVVLKYLAAHRQAAAKAAFQQRFPSVPGSVLDNPMNRVLRKSPHREEVLKLRAQVWPEETRAKINEINARQVNET
ncbi:MAG: RNA polymerase sigma factor, partial [Limisphaerales bacterium]